LSSPPYSLPTLVFSIDDLYLPHSKQEALAESQANNPLVQHRGQPSTHDVKLGPEVFAAISNRKPNIHVPSYDKSAFNGAGDRLPESKWEICNRQGERPVEVVIFEGWCVGFRALDDGEVEHKWKAAVEEYESKGSAYSGRLGKLQLDSVKFVNNALREYDEMTR
jgi:D-glycerate 3-kinase